MMVEVDGMAPSMTISLYKEVVFHFQDYVKDCIITSHLGVFNFISPSSVSFFFRLGRRRSHTPGSLLVAPCLRMAGANWANRLHPDSTVCEATFT